MSKTKQKPKELERSNIQLRFDSILAWLEHQDDTLSFGLRTLEDAGTLYDYFTKQDKHSRYADDMSPDITAIRVKLLGYDPMTAQSKRDIRVTLMACGRRLQRFALNCWAMTK